MTDTGEHRQLTPTSEKLASLYKIWRELAAGGVGPRREDVTPARLRGLTPSSFLIDVADKDFRFRFAGDRIIQFIGRRLTGTQLSEHMGTPFFDGMHQFFGRCVEAKMPMLAEPAQSIYPGKEHLEIEVIVLPLSDDGLTVTGLLGSFDTWQLGTHGS